MPGSNTDTQIPENDDNHGNSGKEMSSNIANDSVSPSKDVSAPENAITRLEDEVLNPNLSNLEIQNKRGNSVAPKLIVDDEEGESCSMHSDVESEITEKILKNSNCDDGHVIKGRFLLEQVKTVVADQKHEDICGERPLNFGKGNDTTHQEWARGEANNATCMSNLGNLDNALTEKDQAFEAINQNNFNMTLHTETAIVKDVSYGLPNELFSVETESVEEDCKHRNFRDALSAREPIRDLVGEVLSSKVTSHKSATINEGIEKRRELTIDSYLVSRGIDLVDAAPDDSSQSSVECDYGIKLYVDMKNNTPVDLNTENYRLLRSDPLHECNTYAVDVQKNAMKSPRVSEETSNLAGKKMELSKFIDSHAFETEKAISEIPHVDSGDPHLGTCRLGCLAVTTRENIPKKIGASKELRRASLMLIPPRGVNRCSSSLMSRGSSKARSARFSNVANGFLSFSSAGDCSKPQTCKEQEEDSCLLACSSESRLKQAACSNHPGESCMPMVEKSSKALEGSHLQTGVLENKWYHEETKPGFKITMAVEETIIGDANIKVEAKKGPPVNNFDQQDVEMIDSELFGASCMRNPKHGLEVPQGFENEMEVQHVKVKDIQRYFKIHAQRETYFSNLMVESEAKGKRLQSRFMNDYKKFPFSRKFRNMNNLARISSMREGILALRRSTCVVSASVDHICMSQKVGGESRDTTKDDHTKGNSENQMKTKFCVFGKKRFLEKALVESGKRLQTQKMLRSGVYDRLPIQKDENEIDSNSAYKSSKEVNQTSLNITVCENELHGETMIEQKKRRQEQFKKSFMGKSREKAKEIAKRVALFQRTQILQSKRGNTSTTLADTNIQETSDGTL